MQLDLLNFEGASDSKKYLYDELKKNGYVDSHKMYILETLWDLKSHTSNEVVSAGGKQYNARVLELRREGWNIVCERGLDNQFYFRLLNHNRRVM
jgi:hypothetical protein